MRDWKMFVLNKPKGDFSEYSFTIEIILTDENGCRYTEIVSDCKYYKKEKYFQEYGTNKKYPTIEVFNWCSQD
jgi:hypothetical protein